MKIRLDNYKLALDIKEGTRILDEKKYADLAKFSQEQRDHLICVLSESRDSVTTLTYCEKLTADELEDIKGFAQAYVNQMKVYPNIKLKRVENTLSSSKRKLKLIEFVETKSGRIIISAFVFIGVDVYLINTNTEAANYENAYEFSKDLAKSIVSVK